MVNVLISVEQQEVCDKNFMEEHNCNENVN